VDQANVCIEATDPVAASGLATILAQRSWLTLTEAAASDVLILLADTADDRLIDTMRAAYQARAGALSCIIIAYEISPRHLAEAAELGLIGLLQRATAEPDRICDIVSLTRSVRPILPSSVLPTLLEEFRRARPAGEHADAMSEREAEVLSLYADGLSAADVGRRLDLSVRTIRKIEQEVVTRLNLRNRTHAVAYAFRAGVLTPPPRPRHRQLDQVR
jgi:DNA-binding NarL/FixJ family response regulator